MACQVFPFVMTTDWHESEAQPYICHRASQPIIIDGDLSKPAWRNATKSPRFVDMISGAPGMFNTQMAALWDDTNLYVAFWVEEPFVEAHLTERDSTIFQENDVEVFIDGGSIGVSSTSRIVTAVRRPVIGSSKTSSSGSARDT